MATDKANAFRSIEPFSRKWAAQSSLRKREQKLLKLTPNMKEMMQMMNLMHLIPVLRLFALDIVAWAISRDGWGENGKFYDSWGTLEKISDLSSSHARIEINEKVLRLPLSRIGNFSHSHSHTKSKQKPKSTGEKFRVFRHFRYQQMLAVNSRG